MKFAFSTANCPTWDLATLLTRAKDYGYDGVEIVDGLNPSQTATLKGDFATAGIEIACLATSIAYTGKKKSDAALAASLRRAIDTAATIGTPLVKVLDTQLKTGHSRLSTAVALGDWLAPLGDYAAERDITIVIENALSFRQARDMWTVIDRLQHPAIACCWNVLNAALVGESPYISVPVLNSRIQYAHLQDAKLSAAGPTACTLGEGDVDCQTFITRLRGIGYEGYVTVEWGTATQPSLGEPEAILPDAIKKLKAWQILGVEKPGVAKKH